MGILIPFGLLLLYFVFYNNFQISPSEAIKTTGLWSISLLGITLLVGPLSNILPPLEFLKQYRKVWGVTAAMVGLLHVSLVFIFFYKFDITRFWNFSNPRYPGIASGLAALAILLLVTFTSSKKALQKLSPEIWKLIQTTSYIAMFFAVLHFFLMESKDGVLVIKRLLGQITFYFSILVLLIRILVIFLPNKKK